MVNGIALGLSEPNKLKFKRKLVPAQLIKEPTKKTALNTKIGGGGTDDELIFSLEEEQVTDLTHSPTFPANAVSTVRNQLITQTGSLKLKSRSPLRPIFRSVRLERHVFQFTNLISLFYDIVYC